MVDNPVISRKSFFRKFLSIKSFHLTVTATKAVEKDKEKKGRTIRQERYDGTLQRSFYVGEALTEEDITAKLEHGVLSLSIPKKAEKKLPEKNSSPLRDNERPASKAN